MLLELILISYGVDGDAGFSPSLMFHEIVRRSVSNPTVNNSSPTHTNTTSDNATLNAALPVAAPISDPGVGDETEKDIFIIGVLIGFCVFAVIGVTMTVVCWVRSDQHKVLPASPRKSDKLSGGEKERKFPLSRPSSQLAIGTVELELQQQPLTTRELENLPTREILDAKKEEKTSEQSKETRARSGSLPLYSPAARPRTDTQLSENSPLRSTSHFTYSTEKPTPFNKTSSYNSQSSYPESPAVECTPSCVFMFKKLACNVIPVWCSFITCRISNAKKPKDTEFKAKDAENLDKQNMRDVQLSEYEKRKRQMKELDNQQEEPPDDHLDESDDGGELDEITAVQSQPLEEETIVNPNFIHHYIPRSGSRSGSIRGH